MHARAAPRGGCGSWCVRAAAEALPCRRHGCVELAQRRHPEPQPPAGAIRVHTARPAASEALPSPPSIRHGTRGPAGVPSAGVPSPPAVQSVSAVLARVGYGPASRRRLTAAALRARRQMRRGRGGRRCRHGPQSWRSLRAGRRGPRSGGFRQYLPVQSGAVAARAAEDLIGARPTLSRITHPRACPHAHTLGSLISDQGRCSA